MATEVLIEPKLSLQRPLEGKVALITGASRGIGRAIAYELADRGATIALNYRSNSTSAEEVRNSVREAGGECELFQHDISDRVHAHDMVHEVADRFHHIDILVNNAGMTRDRSIRKMTDEDWLAVIETNLNSVFYCTSSVVPMMVEQKFGRIVNIASYIAQGGAFGQANYAASKGGIISFTKVLALELAKFNVTANAVCPGFTETDMLANVPDNVRDQIKARIPMGRFGLPAEMAKAVGFLVCDGDYITGQQINVNGGIYM